MKTNVFDWRTGETTERDMTSEERAAITLVSFEDRQGSLISAADLIAKEKRDKAVAGISTAEMANWPIKRGEALAYQSSGEESDAPNLQIEADARGVSLSELAVSVLAKATELSRLEALIAGHCGKLQDALHAAQSDPDLDAVDITSGWPN